MAVMLSALRAGRPLPPGRFLVPISVRGSVDPRAIVRLEGLGEVKNPMTSPVRIDNIHILSSWTMLEPGTIRIQTTCLTNAQ
jgi:hypothetical protein